MPADYEQIRAENIGRYGWDTAVLDLLGHLYSERTHFIFELIQNAEDAGATQLSFELQPGRLEVRHDGRPFTADDVRGVCGVGVSDKAGDLTAIGRFGIGFKSVYAYTRGPQVHSGDEHFRIENFVRPVAAEPVATAPGETVFIFPFDRPDVPAAEAAAEIADALRRLPSVTLLFLRAISSISSAGTGLAIERTAARRSANSQLVTLTRAGAAGEDWLVWERELDAVAGRRAEIAFRADDGILTGVERSPLVVFFPTERETFCGFLVQGPYRTTPARDNVAEHDPANQAMAARTAALLTEVLGELRDDGLLTASVLQALPLDAARFAAGTLLRPLFESATAALGADKLVPVLNGGYGRAADVVLTPDPGLRTLLSAAQLGDLLGRPAAFADDSITPDETPRLWQYLTTQTAAAQLTPEAAADLLTIEFLAAQPDEWIIRLYAWLDERPSLWRDPGAVARTRPVIRLADGSQVAPFGVSEAEPGPGPEDPPAVFLPGPARTSLPVVRAEIAADPAARRFLEALGLTEPDLVADVLHGILPGYDGLDTVDPAHHDADLEAVAVALEQASAPDRERLLERLARTTFLIGENAATGEQRLLPPDHLYLRTRDLDTYFDGNGDCFFAADRYGPWARQLTAMGVRDAPLVRRRLPDPLGYVVVADEFARHERGLDGFDPGGQIDGLEFALQHPAMARSEYVWNALLVPNAALVSGVVEDIGAGWLCRRRAASGALGSRPGRGGGGVAAGGRRRVPQAS